MSKPRKPKGRPISGWLILDKPLDFGSTEAVSKIKWLFKAQKAGHAGTLDPLASGLLMVLFGEATKFAGPLLDADKEYLATLKLGARTSTGDAEGAVLQSREVSFFAAVSCAAAGRAVSAVANMAKARVFMVLASIGVVLTSLHASRRVLLFLVLVSQAEGGREQLTRTCSNDANPETASRDWRFLFFGPPWTNR